MRARIIHGVIALCLIAFASTGCAAEESLGSPDIRGVISAITIDDEGDGGTILVVGELEADTEYDQAYISVGDDVEIVGPDGKRAAFDEFSPRTEVEVWFIGPVAESYPVQATAERVEILGYDVP